ncbi:hypothetical protein ZWY2020_035891 [Hordeum vulgare]|nr:hypothetical protein ZWY2020_035891 [Hordeum vulgare]
MSLTPPSASSHRDPSHATASLPRPPVPSAATPPKATLPQPPPPATLPWRYVTEFSDGAIIEKDSVEEYELLAKHGGDYPSFISWFKQMADAESMDAELRQVANGFYYQTYYRCEEGYEEDATKVIKTECHRLLQNFRHEACVQAVRDYYATQRIRIDKAKCRDAKMEKEHYMKAMAHTASYKKVKAFSESDLEHPENFTNISFHYKLVK